MLERKPCCAKQRSSQIHVIILAIIALSAFGSPVCAVKEDVADRLISMMSEAGYYYGAPQNLVVIKTMQSRDNDVELAAMEDPATGMAYPVLISTKINGTKQQPMIELLDRYGFAKSTNRLFTEGDVIALPFEVSQATWTVSFFSGGETSEKAELHGKIMKGYTDIYEPPYFTMFSLAPQMEIESARHNGEPLEYYRPRGASAFFVLLPGSAASTGTIEFELKLNKAPADMKAHKKIGITLEEFISYSPEKQYAALSYETHWNVLPAVSEETRLNCTATAVFNVPSEEYFLSSRLDSDTSKNKESRPNMETITGTCYSAADRTIAFKTKKQKISIGGSEAEIIYMQDDRQAETAHRTFSEAAADFNLLLGPLYSPLGLRIVIDPNDDNYKNRGYTGLFTPRVNGDFIHFLPNVLIERPLLYHELFHAWVHGICEKNDKCRGKKRSAPAYFYNEAFAYFLGSTKAPTDFQTAFQSEVFERLHMYEDNYQFGPKLPSVLSFENSEQNDFVGSVLYDLTFKKGRPMLRALTAEFGVDVVKKSIGDYITSGKMFDDDARFSDFFEILKNNGANADSFYRSWIEGSKLPQYCLKSVSFSEKGQGKGILSVTLEQKKPFYDLKLPIFARDKLEDMGGDEYLKALSQTPQIGMAEFSTSTATFEYEMAKAPDTVYAFMSGKTQCPFPMDLESTTGFFNVPAWEVERFPKALIVMPDKKDQAQANVVINTISNFLTFAGFKSVVVVGHDVSISEFDEFRFIIVIGNPAKNRYLSDLMKKDNSNDEQILKILNGEGLSGETSGLFLHKVVPVEYREAKIDWLLSFGEKPEPDPEEYPQARQFYFINYAPGFPLELTLYSILLRKLYLPSYYTYLVYDLTGTLIIGSQSSRHDPTYAHYNAATGQYTTYCDLSK